MARIGSVTPQLSAAELRRRILVSRDVLDFDHAFEAERVWLGGAGEPLGGGLLRRLIGSGAPARMNLIGEPPKQPPFEGLRSLLETHHRTRIDYVEADVADAACRALPFRHVVLATPEAGPQISATEANLRAYFEEQLGAWADGPARIRYVSDPLLPRRVSLRAQFGHGVFLPDASELPVGRFELAEAVGRDGAPGVWRAPRLGGRDGPLAAFYRGQTGVAFASALRFAPAVAEGGVLPDDHVFFFGRLSAEDPPFFEAFTRDAAGALAPSAAYALDGEANAPVAQRVVRDASGRPAFHLRWIGDDGPTALRPRAPAQGPYLAVEGLVMPACGWLREVRRWWIDVTAAGRLATAPLDERAIAVAGDPSGAVRLYDRRERVDRGMFAAPRPVPLSPDQELRRPSFSAPDRATSRLWRTPLQGLRELGFIPIGQADAQRFNPFRSLSREEISLDWLNACGAVETRLRDARGAARRIGLAEWSLRDGEAFCRLRDGGLDLVSRNRSLIARLSADGALRPSPPNATVRIAPGEEFVLGCLHLRFLPGPDTAKGTGDAA